MPLSYVIDDITTSDYSICMRIKTTIGKACRQRGLDTAYKLQSRLSLPPATAARLFADRITKIDLATLARLMEGLSQYPENRPKKCKLTDLFEVSSDLDK